MKNSVVKKSQILRDSIIKNVDGWILNRKMKSIVSVRKCNETSRYGCLEDGSPDTILLHYGTKNLRGEENAEKIASNINVALYAKNKKTLYNKK